MQNNVTTVKTAEEIAKIVKAAEIIDDVFDYILGELKAGVTEIEIADKIKENGLYLLDEPENSLSPARQQELVQFLEDSARFFGCQFIIATHSPFLLSMKGAKIYDLDANPVQERRWTELPNVRAYYDFFKKHESEF